MKKYCFYGLAAILLLWQSACSVKRNAMENRRATTSFLMYTFSEQELHNELISRSRDSAAAFPPIERNAQLAYVSVDSIYVALKGIETRYGRDNRHNPGDKEVSEAIRKDADRVACLVLKEQIEERSDGSLLLKPSGSFRSVNRLCSMEKFAEETCVSFCSGFAIAPDQFVTAGHCMAGKNLSDVYIVYGYSMKNDVEANLIIPRRNVFRPSKIVRQVQSQDFDFAVLQATRAFPAEKIVAIRKEGRIPESQAVHVIGYPGGLPVKVALDAKVGDNSKTGFFMVNSDTYAGNSGSPVFNSITHEVEGILVAGGQDFIFNHGMGCNYSFICTTMHAGCLGEKVCRIRALF